MDPPSNIPRPSGIPRPAASRLPVLRAPASSSQLRKKPSLASLASPSRPAQHAHHFQHAHPHAPPANASTATPLARKPSRASLAPSAARRVSSIPAAAPSPPPRTSSQHAPAFRKPFARPSSQPLRTPSTTRADTREYTRGDTSEHTRDDDRLGHLDGFRAASRASSRADSRAGFHDTSSSPDHVPDGGPDERAKRKPRPSLSERTVESLAMLPSSPANGKTRRRRSSFFGQDNAMPPPLRPASAMSDRKPASSRPSTSDGAPDRLPTTPSKPTAASSRLSMTVPGKRSVSANVATPTTTTTPSRISSVSRPATAIKKPALAPAQNTHTPSKPAPLSASKNLASRTPNARPPVAGTFGQAISPPGTAPAPSSPATARKAPSSSLALRNSIAQAKAARKQDAAESPSAATPKKAETSSNALREQIAKAREAAKRTKPAPVRADTPPKDAIIPDPDEIASFDFGLDDPFNQNTKGGQSVLRKRVDGARATGRLNIAGMQLTEMPDEVLRMYDPNDTTVAWGEIMDVTTILAADNEFTSLPDSMFPDVDINDYVDTDDAGPQFGGVQSLDLHGNLLQTLPMGLCRLAELTKLNLSRNNLSVDAFDVISKIAPLRELKLTENNLVGELPSNVASLTQLEVLDLANNKLIALPAEIRELTQLRTLSVADNQLRAVPMDLFTSTSLVELNMTKNRLEGAFFSIASAPHLQKLLLASNALTSLSQSPDLDLPVLQFLDIAANRLSSLPDMTSWSSLGTILLGENKLVAFPDGFFSLKQLRIADFTANDISKVDERIALMEGLETLTLAANPIRERKFLTMSTDDMKRDLHARLQPEEMATGSDDSDFADDEPAPIVSNGWTVTPAGTLDLASKGFTEVDEDAVLALSETSDIRQINLQNNLLQTIPLAFGQLAYLSILDLSKNSIAGPPTSQLELPKLRELRLSSNKLNSLTPLTASLTAPALQTLDVSQNRLTGSLPALRASFPALITLLASDNALLDVPADSLSGLKTVNLSNNNIERLDPRIGLLAPTLTSLIVEGNRFRVPNYHVLSKGTDAVLSWLKDRIPSAAASPNASPSGSGSGSGSEAARKRGDSAASTATRTTEGGSEFFDAEDGAAW